MAKKFHAEGSLGLYGKGQLGFILKPAGLLTGPKAQIEITDDKFIELIYTKLGIDPKEDSKIRKIKLKATFFV